MKRIFLMVFPALFLAAVSLWAAAEKSNVGTKMPALSLEYISNKPSATKGKPMIVEFWATWCGPCRQSIPHLNDVYAKYKDKGLVVIGITAEDKSKVEPFMKEIPMDYSVAQDADKGLQRGFGVSGIPHALLVDATGKIVWEGHPLSMKDSDIEAVLPKGGAKKPSGVEGYTPPPPKKGYY